MIGPYVLEASLSKRMTLKAIEIFPLDALLLRRMRMTLRMRIWTAVIWTFFLAASMRMTLRMRIWTALIWTFLLSASMRMTLRMRIWTAEIWTFLPAASMRMI